MGVVARSVTGELTIVIEMNWFLLNELLTILLPLVLDTMILDMVIMRIMKQQPPVSYLSHECSVLINYSLS